MPGSARWSSRDPIHESGSINIFSFLNNNSVNNADYIGMLPVPLAGGAAGWKILTWLGHGSTLVTAGQLAWGLTKPASSQYYHGVTGVFHWEATAGIQNAIKDSLENKGWEVDADHFHGIGVQIEVELMEDDSWPSFNDPLGTLIGSTVKWLNRKERVEFLTAREHYPVGVSVSDLFTFTNEGDATISRNGGSASDCDDDIEVFYKMRMKIYAAYDYDYNNASGGTPSIIWSEPIQVRGADKAWVPFINADITQR